MEELGRVTSQDAYAERIGRAYADHMEATWWSVSALHRSLRVATNLVAEADGRLAGVATLGERRGEPVLWKLYVLPAYQGQGIGTRLVDAVLDLVPVGCSRLLLEYVDGNEPAAAFYRSRGFVEVGREPDSDGWPDTMWMALPLSGQGGTGDPSAYKAN